MTITAWFHIDPHIIWNLKKYINKPQIKISDLWLPEAEKGERELDKVVKRCTLLVIR